MPIEKPKSSAASRADQTFERLSALPKPKTTVSGKLLPRDKEALRVHFESIGLSLAAGVTMVLKKYMNEQGI